MSAAFSLILAYWLSGQMSEAQWAAHLENELFCAWLRKSGLAV